MNSRGWRGESYRHSMSSRGVLTAPQHFVSTFKDIRDHNIQIKTKMKETARSLEEYLTQNFPNFKKVTVHEHVGELIVYIHLKPTDAMKFKDTKEAQEFLNVTLSESPHPVDVKENEDSTVTVDIIMLSSFFHPDNLEYVLNDVRAMDFEVKKRQKHTVQNTETSTPKIVGKKYGDFLVQTSDGILQYNESEMTEIYGPEWHQAIQKIPEYRINQIIGLSGHDDYFVQTSDGIMEYSENELEENYGPNWRQKLFWIKPFAKEDELDELER